MADSSTMKSSTLKRERTGLLLVNLGTPASPEVADVRRYLRQFLMDKRVLDMPTWRRFLLVHLLILPTRPSRSAESYRKIWTERGSPLLFHGQDLKRKVQKRVGEEMPVELAMRYGEPSVERALGDLHQRGVSKLVVMPLYAQASEASTGSTVAEVRRVVSKGFPDLRIEVVPPFFDHPSFVAAKISMARQVLERENPDLVLFSYHGLPVRQLERTAPELGCMGTDSCCEQPQARTRCYRAQCFANARALADGLGLVGSQYRVCFQSRLGRTPWIPPYTDEVLAEEACTGRKVVVISGFVADCLETLEEMQIAGRETWQGNGGSELHLVAAPNAQDVWADALLDIVAEPLARLCEG